MVVAVPEAPASQLKHKKCQGGWSPILMTLDAKLTTITTIAYRVRGVGAWWRSPTKQAAGIHAAITKWNCKV